MRSYTMASFLLLLSLMATTSSLFVDEYIFTLQCDGQTNTVKKFKYCNVAGISTDAIKYYQLDLIRDDSSSSPSRGCNNKTYALKIRNNTVAVRVDMSCNGYFGIKPKETGFPYKGGCGQDNTRDFKITDGDYAQACQFPWVTHIRMFWREKYPQICEGSIISDRWILTAAYCVYLQKGYDINTAVTNISVYTGSLYTNDDYIFRSVKRIVKHPKYNPRTYDYNIALLELEEPIKWDGCHAPVCLNMNKTVEESASLSCRLIGWEKETLWTKPFVWNQHHILPRSSCDKAFGDRSTNDTFCGTATANGTRDGICRQSFGSILVCQSKQDDIIYQYGITALVRFRPGYCWSEILFTNVAALYSWIRGYVPPV